LKKYLLLIVLLPFLFLRCNGQPKKFESIAPTVFSEKIKTTEKPQILDVRTPKEFEEQHIDNAVNLNWNSDDFISKANLFDKTKSVFVYCLSGGRSKQAAAKLEELGFTSIYELQGGIMKWNAAGLATQPEQKITGMTLNEYQSLLQSDKKVLVNFYAEWCAPCKKMQPYMLQMQKDWSDKVVIIRLNADEHKTLLKELKIVELPTLLLYEKSKIKWQHSGFISEEDLKQQL